MSWFDLLSRDALNAPLVGFKESESRARFLHPDVSEVTSEVK